VGGWLEGTSRARLCLTLEVVGVFVDFYCFPDYVMPVAMDIGNGFGFVEVDAVLS
jgi:hypothetical protein